MYTESISRILSLGIAAAILSSCVSNPPDPGGQASPTGAVPVMTWHATHDWVTRRWAESTVHLSVNGVNHAVGNHASKEAELVELRPFEYPNFIPQEAVSAVRSHSSSGMVYYYAVPKGSGQLSVFQYHRNDMTVDNEPARSQLTTIRY